MMGIVRVIIGVVFLVGGFLALMNTWFVNIPTPTNPPSLTFNVDEFWDMMIKIGIEGAVIAIGIWLVAGGHKSTSSSH